MFQNARFKLTAWYLLIIMLISLSFSLVIFNFQSNEIKRFARAQRLRIERGLRESDFFPPNVLPPGNFPQFSLVEEELVAEAEHRLLLNLIVLNGGILIAAGGLGYFLAGRTLKPIKIMLEEQKQFITDSSHELRTPLTSLKSSLEVNLRDQKLTLKEAKRVIKESIEDVDKLQLLSDKLLELSQYEKTDCMFNFQNLSLSEIIKDAITRVEPLAKQKNEKIINLASDLKIEADRVAFINLLVILLDNAIKYSPPNKTIEITSRKNDGQLLLSIEDRGMGIEEKNLPHIFDRFYRADVARSKENVHGYGLGLSIAQKIITNHHGSITVKSKVNQGSTFTIALPLQQSARLPKTSFFSKFSGLVFKI
ncbi:MAG: cell wall metabolism sensor histidine kinase WalK [Patescibacteria group bacterium]|nr:cell wall metabolism sensor histidine kinase WalK [Patescibacteria group bacterium]